MEFSKVCFETIKVENGVLLNLEYHQKRLDKSREILGYKDTLSLKKQIKDIPKKGVYRLRVEYEEKIKKFTCKKYEKREINSFKILNSDIKYDLKYANRQELDALYAQREDCDDILIVSNNLLKDTSIANIALMLNNTWYTPKKPLLQGTTRARLIESGFLKERDLEAKELKQAQNFAIMNALFGFKIINNLRIDF